MTPNRTLPWLAMIVCAGTSCAPQAGPATTSPAPARATDTVRVVDTVRVQAPSEVDAQLEDQVARLQIQLLARDVQIEGLQEQLDATRQEVVRNMAKLQSQATRAEAASGMAEAEIALEALRRVVGGEALSEFAQAEARIAESTGEFDAENYVGALYLATQARTLARSGQARLRSGAPDLASGETLFALPVPLQTVSRSNVRDGPSLGAEVLFTLEGGTDLVGQSYTSQWVRAVDPEGREGWIFHTLVTGRR